jgi:arginyl-tRNA synthetase
VFKAAQNSYPQLLINLIYRMANNVDFTHAHNGFIKLKEGAMSTRHGTVIFLQALIDEGNERTGKILEEK